MAQNIRKRNGPEIKKQQRKSGQHAALVFAVVIAIASFAVYSNAIANGFIYDDHSQVLKNSLIRDIRNIPEIFRSNAWTFEGAPPTSNYYRPMLNLIYMFTYYVFGLHAWGFHLVNILFHAANSVLVFFLAAGLMEKASSDQQGKGADSSSLFTFQYPLFLPFLAGLLFATHPVLTEAVTWVAGLSDVSFAFFYLLSFYFYMRSGANFRWQYALSVMSFLLAVLCKEPGLTLPVILAAYDYTFHRLPSKGNGAATAPPAKRLWLYYAKRYLPYLFVICAYLIVRVSVLGAFTPLKRLDTLRSVDYFINVFPLLSRYLYKLIMPLNLNFWTVYTPVTSLVSEKGVLSLFVTIALTGLIVFALKKDKVLFLGLLLVLVPLAPALYIKGIAGKFFSERYLYLPSAGFAVLLAYVFARARTTNAGLTKGLGIIFAVLIGLYSFGTFTRNTVWKDEYSLFADTVRKSPDSVVPRLEFGNALLARGRFDEAIEQYRAAAAMEPMLYVIYHHMGLAFAGKNLASDAISQYKIALELNPAAAEVHADLGRTYLKNGFLADALRECSIAAGRQPTAANHNLLGIAYAKTGQMERAVEEFRAAAYLDPVEANYRRNLDEAVRLTTSPSSGNNRGRDFTGRFEEKPAADPGIIRFAW